MITVRQLKPGLWAIMVHVTPKSGKNVVLPASAEDDMLNVKVTAVPDKGAANAAVIELLSKTLGIPKSQVKILRGETSRQKQVGFHVDWTQEDWQKTLVTVTGGEPAWFEILP